MYTYSFKIYGKGDPYPYLTLFLKAKDRFSKYDSILIRAFDEKPEDWSPSVQDSCIKKEPYNRKIFFGWLRAQRVYGYTGWINPEHCSPQDLYIVLRSSNIYNVIVDTDDPEDIGDYSGAYDSDDDDPDIVY